MRISRGGITEQVTLLGYLGQKYPALTDFVYDAGELSLDPEHVGGGPDYSDVIYRPLIDAMMSTVAGLGAVDSAKMKRLFLTPTFNEITSLSLQFHGINNYTCLKALPISRSLKSNTHATTISAWNY
jgi:hypothetical protein